MDQSEEAQLRQRLASLQEKEDITEQELNEIPQIQQRLMQIENNRDAQPVQWTEAAQPTVEATPEPQPEQPQTFDVPPVETPVVDVPEETRTIIEWSQDPQYANTRLNLPEGVNLSEPVNRANFEQYIAQVSSTEPTVDAPQQTAQELQDQSIPEGHERPEPEQPQAPESPAGQSETMQASPDLQALPTEDPTTPFDLVRWVKERHEVVKSMKRGFEEVMTSHPEVFNRGLQSAKTKLDEVDYFLTVAKNEYGIVE